MAELPPIKFTDLAAALLARADHLVPAWLPGGVQRGHEWVCGGLTGGPGGSCSVNLNTGAWADFAADEQGGDLVSLYAAIHGLTMGKAALAVARDEGLEDVAGVKRSADHQPTARPERPEPPPAKAKPPRSDEGWVTVRPVPANAPAPTFKHYYRPATDIALTSEYRVGDELHGFVVRFVTSDGGKDDLPYTWTQSSKDGSLKWSWKQFDEPRPLYLPGHALPAGRTVVLVEGERKAQVLQALLDAGAPSVYCVASWSGGCKAWDKADWSWLAGCSVLAWPDCDSKRVKPTPKELNACADDATRDMLKAGKPYLPAAKQPGLAAMLGIAQHLTDAHACTVQLLAIAEPGLLPDGWDAADAIETDGWDFDRVMQFFGTAYTPDTSGADAAKKIEGPVGTNAGDAAAGAVDDAPENQVTGVVKGELPWWLRPYWDAEKERWNVSRKTIIAALRHDDQLAGALGFNQLSNNMELRLDWPFPQGKAGRIKGTTDLLLGDWLSATYKLPAVTRQAITEAMETVAHENAWHPIHNYLQGLKWDGVSRIDKWLLWTLGETPDSLTPEMVEYFGLVGRYWLLGMINRVMEPGCKYDYCPVLEGPGGLGKSTMVEVLASTAWYSDTTFEIGKGKESSEQVGGVWVIELPELSAMGKSEVTAVKAFITSKVDRYRPAYARTIEEFPRQCVLVGTTNENTYLRDRTGNRRFWPIPVKQPIKTGWLARWRDQLFAEAFALYQEGAAFTPSRDEEARLFVPMQEARLVETAVTSELLTVLTRDAGRGTYSDLVNTLTDFVTIDMLCHALGADAGKAPAGMQTEIRTWMNAAGWEYKKVQVNGVRRPGWVRPKDWPPKEADPLPAATATDSPDGHAQAIADALADDAPF